MRRVQTLAASCLAAILLASFVHAGWRIQNINDATNDPPTFQAWAVNWISNYPNFTMMKPAINGSLQVNIKGVTFERFQYYQNLDPEAFINLRVQGNQPDPILLTIQLSEYFTLAPPFDVPVVNVTFIGRHGSQPNIQIKVVKTGTTPVPKVTASLGNVNIFYGRPLIISTGQTAVASFPGNGSYNGEVTIDTDGGIRMLNVRGGIVKKVVAKAGIGAIYSRRVRHAASGVIYGGVIGGNQTGSAADIYTPMNIGYIFANNGLGTALKNGVPKAYTCRICAGYDGVNTTYPSGVATVVLPAGGMNGLICAGSGPVAPYQYGGAIRTILLGSQIGGVLNTCTFVAGPKPRIGGPGKALAVNSKAETNLGPIPIDGNY